MCFNFKTNEIRVDSVFDYKVYDIIAARNRAVNLIKGERKNGITKRRNLSLPGRELRLRNYRDQRRAGELQRRGTAALLLRDDDGKSVKLNNNGRERC